MPRFFYKAKKGPVQTTEGYVDADSESQALSKISALGLFPISIRKELEAAEGSPGGSVFVLFERVKTTDLAVFTRQLADLLDAGITLANGLDILSRQTENKKFARAIADCADYLKTGNAFSAALGRHRAIFSVLYISMVQSGEASGSLEDVLNHLAGFLEEQAEFKTKVQAAMAYPLLMAFVGLATIIVLLTFVMPRVVSIFEDLGQNLPFVTMLLLAISSFIRSYWYLMVVGILAAVFAIRQISRSVEGKALLERLKNVIPILGSFLKKVDMARFARTLGTLLSNGVPLLQALDIVKNVVSSEAAKKDIVNAYSKVRDGSSLARAMGAGAFFSLFVTNMIAVGEESGQLDRTLAKIANSYEREIDKMIKIISSLIEPAMILVMGVIVGFIVISILLPIFQISLIAK